MALLGLRCGHSRSGVHGVVLEGDQALLRRRIGYTAAQLIQVLAGGPYTGRYRAPHGYRKVGYRSVDRRRQWEIYGTDSFAVRLPCRSRVISFAWLHPSSWPELLKFCGNHVGLVVSAMDKVAKDRKGGVTQRDFFQKMRPCCLHRSWIP